MMKNLSRMISQLNINFQKQYVDARRASSDTVTISTPARRHRNLVKSFGAPVWPQMGIIGWPSDDELLKWAKEQSSFPDPFVAAVVLLSFGNLEAYRDVLANRLPRFYMSQTLETIVASVFPLPFRLDSSYISEEKAQRIIAWVEENKEKLTWSEEAGRFPLRSPF